MLMAPDFALHWRVISELQRWVSSLFAIVCGFADSSLIKLTFPDGTVAVKFRAQLPGNEYLGVGPGVGVGAGRGGGAEGSPVGLSPTLQMTECVIRNCPAVLGLTIFLGRLTAVDVTPAQRDIDEPMFHQALLLFLLVEDIPCCAKWPDRKYV